MQLFFLCLFGKASILIALWMSRTSFGCLKIVPDDPGSFCHSQTYRNGCLLCTVVAWVHTPCPKHDYGDNNLGWYTKAQNVCLCSTPGSSSGALQRAQHWAPAEHCPGSGPGRGIVPGTGSVWAREIEPCENIQVFWSLLHLHPDILEIQRWYNLIYPPLLSSHWCTEITELSLPERECPNVSI